MITAGKFLEHFTDYPWLHFDIAGSAFLKSADSYRSREGTGVGVRLLFDFLKKILDCAMNKIKVGITIGDINGIGLEVILKTLANPNIVKTCIPVIYGSSKVVSYHRNIVGIDDLPISSTNSAERLKYDRINIVNCWQEDVNITLGQMSDSSGKYAKISLEQATNDLKQGYIDALVTAPFNKKAMNNANFNFPGHTEYLTQAYGLKDSLMLMVNENLRVGLATNHLPISQVAGAITKQLVQEKLGLLNKTLKQDFGIEKPIIALLGLNPHAEMKVCWEGKKKNSSALSSLSLRKKE